MDYNASASLRSLSGPSRRPKHVSDVSAVGQSVHTSENVANYVGIDPMSQPSYDSMMGPTTASYPTAYVSNMSDNLNNGGITIPNQNYVYGSPTVTPHTAQSTQVTQQQQHYTSNIGGQSVPFGGASGVAGSQSMRGGPQFPIFQQPIVQDMALQYGQHLADHGKQIMENQFTKWVPVTKLKYYFAVDNSYVIHKLLLLFFPFTHKEWSLKYDQENPVQPRYDINAPDLYIPTMAFITYVVVAGLMLGLQQRFTPEILSIQASSALAYCLFELAVYSITLYVVNIKTSLKTLDLMAFSGYKFVIIVGCLLFSTLFYSVGYYMALCYCSLSLGFFLLRTLKTKILSECVTASNPSGISYDPYSNPQQYDYTGGRKRKLYFMFLVAGGQILFSFLLSKHLYFRNTGVLDIKSSSV